MVSLTDVWKMTEYFDDYDYVIGDWAYENCD